MGVIHTNQKKNGFTIVELLIVIVVIGILAAITIVAYNGVQSRANNTAVQADMRNFGMKLEQYYAENGRPPATAAELNGIGYKFAANSYQALIYCKNDLGNFGITARSSSGQGWLYSHEKGTVFTGTVGGSASTTCPQAGVPSLSSDGGYGVWASLPAAAW
ncbi:MAG: prepilin-type N-terminal cleavage/methylation domain-containing protein [Candidatus Saccharimonadales bacterium]